MRAPATPIVTYTPDFSLWSPSDRLNESDLVHWSGAPQPICGVLKTDDKILRFMGISENEPMVQVSSYVDFLSTEYLFSSEDVDLKLKFTTPLLLNDYKLLSRPVTYLSVEAIRKNGYSGKLDVEFLFSDKICVFPSEKCSEGKLYEQSNYKFARMGNKEQKPLIYHGDLKPVNSGYFYVSAPSNCVDFSIIPSENGRNSIKSRLSFENNNDKIVLGLAYDSIYSIEYFGEKLECYWTKENKDIKQVIAAALSEYEEILKKCDDFSAELKEKSLAVGDQKYYDLLRLAYRQTVGAHILAEDKEGNILFISKENGSGAHAATVDITYPSMPLFLLYSPALVKGMVRPIFKYAATDEWSNLYKFAPHDAGFYPLVNGQTYPEGRGLAPETQMPIEECANILIICNAIANAEKSNDFIIENFTLLEQWYEYLCNCGYDPCDQLCTDDFAGRLAHNCNLSIKAIIGMSSFAQMCEKLGFKEKAEAITKTAKDYAKKWICDASNADGTFKLTFDSENTFSMKYNAVWDLVFHTDIFPKDCFKAELESYLAKRQDKYGMPLDNRADYAKSDWILWAASMMEKKDDFIAMISPLWDFYNTTQHRIPMTDLYHSINGEPDKYSRFRNRTVQGGLFIALMLKN